MKVADLCRAHDMRQLKRLKEQEAELVLDNGFLKDVIDEFNQGALNNSVNRSINVRWVVKELDRPAFGSQWQVSMLMHCWMWVYNNEGTHRRSANHPRAVATFQTASEYQYKPLALSTTRTGSLSIAHRGDPLKNLPHSVCSKFLRDAQFSMADFTLHHGNWRGVQMNDWADSSLFI